MIYKELIKLIECFADSNKLYWINALQVKPSIKGYLIYYFNL